MERQCDMKKCWYVKTVKQYENFYMDLQEIRKTSGGFDTFVEQTEKLMDNFEHIAEEHAPDEIGGN